MRLAAELVTALPPVFCNGLAVTCFLVGAICIVNYTPVVTVVWYTFIFDLKSFTGA